MGKHQEDILPVLEEGHGTFHSLHTNKEQAEAEKSLTNMFPLLGLAGEHEQYAYHNEEVGKILDLEGKYLARDGSTDIRAHDNTDGLRQRHEPSLNEAHRHNGGGAGTLDGHGHTSTKDNTEKRRFGEHANDIAHAFTGYELERITDELDSVKEEAYAAEKLHRGKKGHGAFSKI